MATGPVYECIATTTLSSSQSSISFTSISQAYTDLVVHMLHRSADTNTVNIRTQINSVTSGYSITYLGGSTSIYSGRISTGSYFINSNTPANTLNFATTTIDFLGYTDTDKWKTQFSKYYCWDSDVTAYLGLCQTTEAISSLTFTTAGTGFGSGTTFQLYGIKAA
jgi:hypothetical protein